MKKISKEDLKNKLTHEDIKLIEVLSEQEYNESHIKGAVNIPLEIIGTEAKKRFDKDTEIVVYCSDYECSASPTAAKKLDDLDFTRVYHYQGGKKEWSESGLPME
jgi:rhodanese-related sulfurtransferase